MKAAQVYVRGLPEALRQEDGSDVVQLGYLGAADVMRMIKAVQKYAADCALDEAQAVHMTGNGVTLDIALAPEGQIEVSLAGDAEPRPTDAEGLRETVEEFMEQSGYEWQDEHGDVFTSFMARVAPAPAPAKQEASPPPPEVQAEAEPEPSATPEPAEPPPGTSMSWELRIKTRQGVLALLIAIGFLLVAFLLQRWVQNKYLLIPLAGALLNVVCAGYFFTRRYSFYVDGNTGEVGEGMGGKPRRLARLSELDHADAERIVAKRTSISGSSVGESTILEECVVTLFLKDGRKHQLAHRDLSVPLLTEIVESVNAAADYPRDRWDSLAYHKIGKAYRRKRLLRTLLLALIGFLAFAITLLVLYLSRR